MKRVIVWAALSVLFCIGINGLAGQSAHASSDFDNAFRHQTGAFVQSPTCPEQNITSEVAAQLASDNGWPSGPWHTPNLPRDYYRAIVNGTTPGLVSLAQQEYIDPSSGTYKYVVVQPTQGAGPFDILWYGGGTSYGHYARINQPPFYGTGYLNQMLAFDLDASCNIQFHSIGYLSHTMISSDPNPTVSGFSWTSIDLIINGSPLPSLHFNYPAGYAGTPIADEVTDSDGDGLSVAKEIEQGTYDNKADTDGDGLNDKQESVWNTNRDNIFCNTNVTPYVCAYPNPVVKDLYVEIDWMKDSNDRSFKPTSTQLNLVKDAYEDKGIIFHADTGQFGGGKQLPVFSGSLIFAHTENKLDFYDQKNGTSTVTANFNSNRRNIWHYMIAGYNHEVTDGEAGSTGASFPGDDDSIISIEMVESMNPSNIDTAIAGTILHELGHNLCLTRASSVNYPNQPSECIYSEIDKPLNQNPSLHYDSVMNYRFQLSKTNYSDGANGSPDDHDDWHAITLGMDDFVDSVVYEWDDTQQSLARGNNQRLYDSRIEDIQR